MEFKYTTFLKEEFDQKAYLKDALEWLKGKFPEDEYGYEFIHKPNLINTTKTYSVSINGKHFDISGRLMDTNSDGSKDTVLFKIEPVEEEPQGEQEPSF